MMLPESRRQARLPGYPRLTGPALGYLGLATLLLSVVWLFREGAQVAEPPNGLGSVRTALATQVAYDLSASGSSDPVLVVPMDNDAAAPSAVGVAGFRAAGDQTELHVLASGLLASSRSSEVAPDYTVELQLRNGLAVQLGALRPAGKGRWSFQARLSYPPGEIRELRVQHHGGSVLEANVAAAGRWAAAMSTDENKRQRTPNVER